MTTIVRTAWLSILIVAIPAWIEAANYQVTSTADLPDVDPGNGVCDAGGGICTLRAAVQEANQTVTDDTIHVPAGRYVLTRTGPDEDLADLGDLDLLESVDILGAGPADTTIDGNASDRIFDIEGSGVAVVISGMTMRNGSAQSSSSFLGGAIRLRDASLDLEDCVIEDNRANAGAGLSVNSSATASVLRCTFSDNRTLALGFTNANGGAILSQGNLDVDESTLTANLAANSGSGIWTSGAPSASVRNSTISQNPSPGTTLGGGISSDNTEIDLVNSTLYGNGGFGVRFFSFDGSHPLSIKNSIIAASGYQDCSIVDNDAPLDVTGEQNLDSDDTCLLDGAQGDFPATNPELGPLLLNGGSTPTHVPLPGSPVIDSGNNDTCEVADQRGADRPLDGDGTGAVDVCDIGAVEVLPCLGDSDLILTDPPLEAVYEACFTITARASFQVPASDSVTFRSRGAAILGHGFAVAAGASLAVIRDPAAGSGLVLPGSRPR